MYKSVIYLCAYILFNISYETFASSSKPLYLTGYIATGKIKEGQKAAKVKPFLEGIESYSGYITVEPKYSTNLFFWYFPNQYKNESTPLVLWLQGGPGASSLFALFTENGPYVFKNGALDRRYYSWTKYFDVLYIDSPPGSGFSFTESAHGYATNQTIIAEYLHEALRQFLILFPKLQKKQIILSGESYAGKYLPSLAHTILKNKKKTNPKMNVFGLFIGNPWISPEHMLPLFNEYLYSHGLLDKNQQEILRKREEKILTLIKSSKWLEASNLMENTFFENQHSPNTLFQQLTGLKQHYHILKDENTEWIFQDFLNEKGVRKELHVGDKHFKKGINMDVFNKMKADIMKSEKSVFEEVLEHYRVLIYSGQLDIICPWYLQENVFLHLSWNGAWDYYTAERKTFRLKKYLVGYYKTAKTLTDVMIRNAGHMVPTDKPQWALAVLRNFADRYFDSKK